MQDVNVESDSIDLIKLREEHAKIISQWNKKVDY